MYCSVLIGYSIEFALKADLKNYLNMFCSCSYVVVLILVTNDVIGVALGRSAGRDLRTFVDAAAEDDAQLLRNVGRPNSREVSPCSTARRF